MGQPEWQEAVADAAYQVGFEKRLLYHRLGMKLEEGA
jgi:hypothetical protein